ncbi:MAG: methylmalonyl Co-A mutase-associated GTPase MeaB [Candidatus Zixiibacteriota bacterium]|nr:MAG: methylmalonyl Co-A mutase-associated GTPase MeaB [candidate division Zixibacteria bacterium]
MSEKKRRKKKPKPEPTSPSALNVMPGIEAGHDGMPRSPSKASRLRSRARSRAPDMTTEQYAEGVLSGDRTILGRAITLVESNARHHQEQTQEVLKLLIPRAGESIRVGITGVPGAGKSTFIETLGCRLTTQGHKVAVMAVDPSSSLTRGSILGDKIRMERLSQDPNAFIRPSPSGGALGGVTRKTREIMILFEAAGYDVLLIETIGVGQSEIAVRSMVDFFLLILIAGAGDELQGMKKGVFEIADAVLVNKADGANIRAAGLARAEYERALHYLPPATMGWRTGVHLTSALTGEGIDEIWTVIKKFREVTTASGEFSRRRRGQTRDWLHSMVEERLRDTFYRNEAIKEVLPGLEQDVMSGILPVTRGAWQLLKIFEENMGRNQAKDR